MTTTDRNRRIDDQKLTALREGVRYLSRLATSLWLIIGFLLIAVGSVTHEMLFAPEGTLTVPLFDASVSPRGFFIFAPALLLCLHGYLLLERLRFTRKLCKVLPQLATTGQSTHLFLPTFVFRGLAGRGLPRDIWLLVAGSFFVLTLAPIGLFLLIQRAYLPAHDLCLTLFHQGLVAVDVLFLCYFVFRTYWVSRCEESVRIGSLISRFISLALITLGACWLSFCVLTLPRDDHVGGSWANDHLQISRWQPPLTHLDQGRFKPALTDLRFGVFSGIRLPGSDLLELRFDHADLSHSDLRGADLRDTHLDNADLSHADLRGANLNGASLRNARLDNARFDGAVLVEARIEGATARETVFFAADLRRARLVASDLLEADLRLANLDGAWLRGTRLIDADLQGAILPRQTLGLDLRGASLVWASGLEPVLADLRLTDLRRSLLLCGDDLKADVRGATFGDGEEVEGRPGLSTLRARIETDLEERRTFAAATESAGAWMKETIDQASNRWCRVQDREGCTPSPLTMTTNLVTDQEGFGALTAEKLYREIAHELGDRACGSPLIATLMVRKSRGELLPADPQSEIHYALELLERSAEDCPHVEEAIGNREAFWTEVCARWSTDPRLDEACDRH